MAKRTVELPDEIYEALSAEALARSTPAHRVTWGEVMREGLAKWVQTLARRRARQGRRRGGKA